MMVKVNVQLTRSRLTRRQASGQMVWVTLVTLINVKPHNCGQSFSDQGILDCVKWRKRAGQQHALIALGFLTVEVM